MINQTEQSIETNENVIIVGLDRGREPEAIFEHGMDELEALALAAGAEVCGRLVQKKPSVDVRTYIGKGKVAELLEFVEQLDIDTVIFNHELSGSQIRNLEAALECRVIDRTALILDIFALRARSGIAKMQVELAQLKYRLPRLIGLGESMSRTGGGIGTRGPGEQKLELDRRRINKRLSDLTNKLKDAIAQNAITAQRRKKNAIPVVALVGYTNAGKSSIMNYFVERYCDGDKGVFEKDMLFATLDTTHRRIELDVNKAMILVDTVGFVSNLPHDLVEAFKATLSEVLEADLLIHVVDAADPNCERQREVTEETLRQLGVADKPAIVVYNKIDKLENVDVYIDGDVEISIKSGQNVARFIELIDQKIFGNLRTVDMHVPYSDGAVLNELMKVGKTIALEHDETGTKLNIQLDGIYINKYAKYLLEG